MKHGKDINILLINLSRKIESEKTNEYGHKN